MPLGVLLAPAALASCFASNQTRILTTCPHASDVRGFHAWLQAGRAIRKDQKGIKIVVPILNGDGSKVVKIRPGYVFDVTQMDARETRAAT